MQQAESAFPVGPVPVHNTPFTSTFDELANTALDAWKVPGLSIAVVDGESTFSKARISYSINGSSTDSIRGMDLQLFQMSLRPQKQSSIVQVPQKLLLVRPPRYL